MTRPTLSLCIATFNRASFLAETLDSILPQCTSECEIVVSDNASADNTEQVVAECTRRFGRVRYFRQDENKGPDRNYNKAVELATGEYCWLLADDDLMRPTAVETVLRAIRDDVSLILVNVEFMDFTLSKPIDRGVDFQSDRIYEPEDLDRLYLEAGRLNGYIGSFVFKREIWMTRNRERYFGSAFIHIGMIYQERLPGKALLIAQPLISMRMGNVHEWWPRHFDICMNWRALVGSLALSESTMQNCLPPEPWKDFKALLWERALGAYSLVGYRRHVKPRVRSFGEKLFPIFVALVPVMLVSALFSVYFRMKRRLWGEFSPDWHLQVLRESRIQRRKQMVNTA